MKKIKITRGKIVLIDDDDFEKISGKKWIFSPKNNHGYAQRAENGTTIKMHRFIMNAKKGEQVDHINGNGLDNRKSNLRIVSSQENSFNRVGVTGKNIKGVYKRKVGNNIFYVASIRFNYKSIYLGWFKDITNAAKAYDKKAIELFGEYAKTNFKKGDQ